MTVLEDFLNHYKKEYDFYFNLCNIVENKIREETKNRGIKCIISSRAKSIESIEGKISKRNEEKPFEKIQDI